jgi:hypothetical protein
MSHAESPIYQGFKFVLSMKVLKPPKSGVPVKPVDIAEKQRLLVVVEAYEVGCRLMAWIGGKVMVFWL